ncbi:MAG: PLP-dependent lyase/thiolase, partial [Nitrospirota bacterium]|nr:PLP-dependent lyase/thiolase [Nitrospirota bacterium]
GDPRDNKPGQRIVIPEHPSQIAVVDVDLEHVRRSYVRHALEAVHGEQPMSEIDLDFLAAETRSSRAYVKEAVNEWHRTT